MVLHSTPFTNSHTKYTTHQESYNIHHSATVIQMNTTHQQLYNVYHSPIVTNSQCTLLTNSCTMYNTSQWFYKTSLSSEDKVRPSDSKANFPSHIYLLCKSGYLPQTSPPTEQHFYSTSPAHEHAFLGPERGHARMRHPTRKDKGQPEFLEGHW